MHPEPINLLPQDRQKRLRSDYFWRLAVVAALLGTVLVVIHGVLLIPTYRYEEQKIAASSAELSSLQTSLASANEQQLNARLSSLAQETSALNALVATTTESAALSELLTIPHPGLALTGFNLAPASDSITGIADTRDDLRSYYLALSNTPGITSVNLPVSDYAVSAQIPFTMTFALP